MVKKTNKPKCGCCRATNDLQSELKRDFKAAGIKAKKLITKAEAKYAGLTPTQKQQLKKDLAIGGAIVAGLWGIKRATGKK